MKEKHRFKWSYTACRWECSFNRWLVLLDCRECGAMSWGGFRSIRCGRCRVHRRKQLNAEAGPAHRKVYEAIERGELKPPHGESCVDCSKRAQVYDHRDYAQPLLVDPVCRSCNSRRGPAKRIHAPHPKYVQ